MRGLIAQFLDHIAYERGLSPHTCEAYQTDLLAFASFLESRGQAGEVRAITRDHISAFLADQRRRRMSTATLARRLVAVKVFFAFLCAEGRVEQNVTEVMASPNKGRPLPHTLSEAEVARLLSSFPCGTPLAVRDRCMLEVFYACGLRVSEVTALRVGDVRMEEGVVRCVGKGDKQRVVPMGGEAQRWLARYLAEVRPTLVRGRANEPGLFLTQRGAPFTRQGIFAMLVKRARAAGIAPGLSPHVLRHCFASHLLAHGANVRAIQEMLGHADIATTQIYTHVDESQAVLTHARFHPRHART